MRLGGDSVRLILIVDGREAGNPLALDGDGKSKQRLFLTTPTIVRVTGGEFMAEHAVTLDGLPPPPPLSPAPPPPPPPTPAPTPTPAVTVSLAATPDEAETNVVVSFTATATPVNGASPVSSYDWDFGDGTPVTTTPANSNTHAYTVPGEKIAIVTAHAGTIASSAQKTVVIIPRKLFVSLTASPGPYTVGMVVTFTATVTSTGPVPAQLTWEWDENADGTPDATVADQPSPQSRNILITATTPATSPRLIRVTVTDPPTGRTATTTLTITVS
jgi:hypothetical protein